MLPKSQIGSRFVIVPELSVVVGRDKRNRVVVKRIEKHTVYQPQVVVADPHAVARQSLRHYLETSEGIRVLAEVSELGRLAMLLDSLQPQALICSAAFGRGLLSFVRALKRVPLQPILERKSVPAIIIYGLEEEWEFVIALARAGSDGLITAEASARDLAESIRAVLRGQAVVSPCFGGILLRELQRWHVPLESQSGVRLTRRETQLLQLVASGMSNKEIAEALSLAESTVKNRLSVLFDKIGVKDRTQAAIFALANGVLQQPFLLDHSSVPSA